MPKSKKSAAALEKRRLKDAILNNEIKYALRVLQSKIPYVQGKENLSKQKTLLLSIMYIRYLENILQQDSQTGPTNLPDFSKTVCVVLAQRNDHRERGKKELEMKKEKENKDAGTPLLLSEKFQHLESLPNCNQQLPSVDQYNSYVNYFNNFYMSPFDCSFTH
ncbi:hypothetical protein GCK72_007131 [Caenorhabditis remanei]|uniref:BHLH domain-containing protein n=1 Tax=Caenorhabditis remanei TaxID=31234 RepID=A0A6A5HN10_CAERE|nr:hypothetical protein GCK72_007131 [Caenorhabditis remanei]KAF1767172.1 hypothetical protein GCK72_007131 [Caenorhabditis remanei]